MTTKKVMVENWSSYPMKEIYNYLAGYTTKLGGKIKVQNIKGRYYDNTIIIDA